VSSGIDSTIGRGRPKNLQPTSGTVFQSYFRTDNLGLLDRTKKEFISRSDKEALRIIEEGYHVLPSGHLCMPCPFNEAKKLRLPRNHQEVKRSTEKQEQKLKEKYPDSCQRVNETHEEALAKGYVKDISDQKDKKKDFTFRKS
jgi:hypothetical protein